MKNILITIVPAIFTILMILGLWNYAQGTSKFYFLLSVTSPFLIIMFGGLCKIIQLIFNWIEKQF